MATPNIVPRADSEGGLGTASKYWAAAYIDAIYVGAGLLGRDADNNIDFSVDDRIQFEIAGSVRTKMTSSTFFPATNDGVALGTTTGRWSDLFLASGAVINIGGNVLVTHSSNALTLADNDKFELGTGGDLQLYHTGTGSIIQNAVGNLTIQQDQNGGDIIFRCDDGSGETTAYITIDGSETLTQVHKHFKFDDNAQLQLGVGSDLRLYHTGSTSFVMNYVGDVRFINYQDDGDFKFETDDGSGGTTEYFRVDGGTEQIEIGKNMRFADNVIAKFGTGGDLQIKHNATASSIENYVGDLTILNTSQDNDIVFKGDDGQANTTVTTYFSLDGSSATHDGSATTALYTNWPDKSRISLGTSHDLQIFHNAANSFIENTGGNLYLVNYADGGDIVLSSDDGGTGTTAYLTIDGGAGNISVAKTLLCADGKGINIGASNDLQISHNGSNSGTIKNTVGNLTISNETDDGDIIFQASTGSATPATYLTLDGSETKINVSCTNGMQFDDNVRIKVGGGSGGDLRIYHDGSNSYISDAGTGSLILQSSDLFLRTNSTENSVVCANNAGVTLYYDNAATLSTTSDGVSVSGDSSTFTSNASSRPLVQIISTANNTDGGYLVFNKDRGQAPADSDTLGSIEFKGLDSGQNSTVYSKITGDIHETTEGDESGELNFFVANNAVLRPGLQMHGDKTIDSQVDVTIGNGSGSRITMPGNIALGGGAFNTTHANVTSVVNLDDNASIFTRADETYIGQNLYYNASDAATAIETGYSTLLRLTEGEFYIYGTAASVSADATTSLQERFKIDTSGNATFAGDVSLSAGALSITGDGSNATVMSESGSGDFEINTVVDIILDAGGGDILLRDDGSGFGQISNNSQDLEIRTSTNDKDMLFRGYDNGSIITALNLDMSDAGAAYFNSWIYTSGGVSITSTAASAVGGGFDGAETCDIQIGEVNQEIITTIQIDLGTGGATDIVSSSTAGDVIGENDTAAAFITKYDSTKNGVLYKAELICLETPAGGDTDINLVLNATSLAEDAAGEAEGHVIVDGGAQTIGMRTESTASVVTAAAGAHNDYIYLTHGGTTAGTYSAGKFLIRLYGALATL